ncbi:hypothetical protein [Actinomadura sp. NBRC 104425]|uniref:hypothetical protein n=1 Tax=Actinomadura sp. NBRC 104425 TaxID=3032204 RepID=UPI00255310CE|nr:hypothetical protein [Actinomadura sp. NBRC 104425]
MDDSAVDDAVRQGGPEPGGDAAGSGEGALVRPGEAAAEPAADPTAEIDTLIGRLSAGENMDGETRGRLLARLAHLLAGGVRRAGAAGLARGRLLADALIAAAPHIPVRDLETLRAHHHGLEGEELADSLVRVASNATTAVGAAGGALAAVEFAAPPLLLSAPAQLAAETLVVAAIEVKLIAELHEVYGVRAQGSGAARAAAYLTAWGKQRGLSPLEIKNGSFTNALGSAAKAALRKRLMRSFGRSISTLGPFLTGAAAGAALNRSATKRVAEAVRADLRRHAAAQPPLGRPVPPSRTELDAPARQEAGDDVRLAVGDDSAGQLPPPGPAPGSGQLPPPAPPPSAD